MTQIDAIEFVAREMCKSMGFDPDESVPAGHADISTAKELAMQGGRTFDISMSVPRWQTYRSKADEVIAADHAMQKLRFAVKNGLAALNEKDV